MTRIKTIIITSVIVVLGILFFSLRVAIKEFVVDYQKTELPKAIEYNDVIASPHASLRVDSAKQSDNSVEQDLIRDNIQSDDKIASSPSAPRNDTNSQLPITNYQLPDQYNLAVPFQPQAPHANWELPYQEACEEASLIMADAFFNKKSLTANEMDERIKKLVAWQQERFGYYEDTTPAEVVIMAQEYFNFKATLDYDISVDNIKKYISQNKLVLVPAAGKILPNPYFRAGGPLYHMLVIRGYTQDKFITNDPGTKRGEEFIYKYDELLNAIHAWPRPKGGNKSDVTEAEMLAGEKVLIIIDKNLP